MVKLACLSDSPQLGFPLCPRPAKLCVELGQSLPLVRNIGVADLLVYLTERDQRCAFDQSAKLDRESAQPEAGCAFLIAISLCGAAEFAVARATG
jgi:hypothetical protein